jgi:hypothetical protein
VGGTPYNCLGVANQAAKLKNEIHRCLWTADDRQRLTQQPTKKGVHNGGEYGEDVRRWEARGEAQYHYFGGIRSGEANKN